MDPKSLNKAIPDPLAAEMPIVALRGQTFEAHREIIPTLLDSMAACGCWLLEQRALSPTATQLSFEIQLRSVFELYSGLLASGVDLSRDSHTCMKSLCTVRDHNPHHARRRRIITVRLELLFLDENDSSSPLARTTRGIA